MKLVFDFEMHFRCVCLHWNDTRVSNFYSTVLLFAFHLCEKGSLCFRFCTLIVKRKERNAVVTHRLNIYRLRLEKGIEEKEKKKIVEMNKYNRSIAHVEHIPSAIRKEYGLMSHVLVTIQVVISNKRLFDVR